VHQLSLHELLVNTVQVDQLLVGTALSDYSFLKDDNFISVLDRRKPVGNNDDSLLET